MMYEIVELGGKKEVDILLLAYAAARLRIDVGEPEELKTLRALSLEHVQIEKALRKTIKSKEEVIESGLSEAAEIVYRSSIEHSKKSIELLAEETKVVDAALDILEKKAISLKEATLEIIDKLDEKGDGLCEFYYTITFDQYNANNPFNAINVRSDIVDLKAAEAYLDNLFEDVFGKETSSKIYKGWEDDKFEDPSDALIKSKISLAELHLTISDVDKVDIFNQKLIDYCNESADQKRKKTDFPIPEVPAFGFKGNPGREVDFTDRYMLNLEHSPVSLVLGSMSPHFSNQSEAYAKWDVCTFGDTIGKTREGYEKAALVSMQAALDENPELAKKANALLNRVIERVEERDLSGSMFSMK
ncbi:hypothetical protein AB4254_12140 [Vibrio breoganii]